MPNRNRSLEGAKVFILEDESLVSMMIEAMVEDLGATVLAAHGRLEPAMEFVASRHEEIDVAVLDVNLGGVQSFDLARALSRHGAPLIFSTGYDDASIPEEWLHAPRINKPFHLDEFEAALRSALGDVPATQE